jgi:O-antigen ligase
MGRFKNTSFLTGLMIFYALSTLISTAVMSLGFGVLVLLFLITPDLKLRCIELWQNRLTRQYLLVSLLLFSVLFLSTVIAAGRNPPLYNHPLDVKIFQECKKLIYLFTPLMVVSIFSRLPQDTVWKVLKSYWIFLGFLVVIGVIQFFTGWPRSQGLPNGNSAAVLFMGLSLSVSSVLSLAAFPLFSLTISKIRKKYIEPLTLDKIRTWLWLVLSLGLMTIIFLTFSRMSWFTLPVGVFILILIYFGRKIFFKTVFMGCLVLGLALFSSPIFRDRALSKGGYQDRIELWRGHFGLFLDHPWIGVGFRQNAKLVETVVRSQYAAKNQKPPIEFFGSHAHNNWIEILASAGLMGFISFLVWNVYLFSSLFKGYRTNKYSWWFLGFVIGFFVFHLNGLTQVNFWDSKVLHTLMFLTGVSFVLLSDGIQKNIPNFKS